MSRFCLTALLVIAAFTTPLVAQHAGADLERYTMEDEVSELLKRYVESRVDRPYSSKPCLNLGGDVRFEYNHYDTKRMHFDENNVGECKKLTDNPYFVNANVYMEFDTCRTWAKLQIEAVNPGGTFPKTLDRIRVKHAIMGYNLWKDDCSRGYVELGRQRLGEHFESQIMYGSRLDGIFGRLSRCMPRLGEAYLQAAYMIADARRDQYAYIGEVGALDVLGQCVYVKASFVDWTNGGRFHPHRYLCSEGGNDDDDDDEVDLPNDRGYRVGQLVIGKKIPCFWNGKKLKTYLGVLYNFDAFRRVVGEETIDSQAILTYQRGGRTAGYAGFQLGEVCACGDWALKLCYQYVQPFAYLPKDNSGIGRTNAGDDAFLVSNFGCLVLVTNYKGIDAEVGYAITDHITARVQFQHANSVVPSLGGPSRFDRFMIRFIYAF